MKLEIQPTTILVSPRADALLIEQEATTKHRQNSLLDADPEQTPPPYEIEIRPGPEFSYEGALQKLTQLPLMAYKPKARLLVPGETVAEDVQIDEIGLSDHRGRLLNVSTWINIDSKVSISCAGAILRCLQRMKASEFLQDDPAAERVYCITSLSTFTCKDSMSEHPNIPIPTNANRLISAETLSALQIITPENHPNAFNQGPGTSGSKESLSVFGLFHHNARTDQGKAKLRQLFLRPTTNMEEINQRLNFISVFSRPDNHTTLQKLSKSFSKIKNMRSIMTMLHKGIEGGNSRVRTFKSSVWSSLLEFCYHSIDVVGSIREVPGSEQLPLCAQALETLDRFQLQRIGKMVHDVVDLDSSIEQNRTVVKRGVDDILDQIKDGYDGMDEMLSQFAIEIAREMPAEVDSPLNVIYFPQLGFHITVPVDQATGEAVWNGGGQHWDKIFTTNNQAYFKNGQMRQLDEDLGDLWAHICDREIEIAYELAQRVLLDEKLLISASDICAEVDCLLAIAHAVTDHHLTRPKLVDDNIIDIKGGRHILQEMTVPSFVPNNTYLVGGKETRLNEDSLGPSMILLTGPNYSGKSVYQKQVALIVYMAQIGCFVPAESCTIGITDKIITRLATRETVSKPHSAFMIDLQQVGIAINSCTARSLIVIDEFGKGTDTCDGAGLAAGVSHHLLTLGDQCPKVLAATHFHEILELGLFNDIPRLNFAHMQVRVDRKGKRKAGDHSSEITYLYELSAGRSNQSYGAQCAAMNGVPNMIVARARQIGDLIAQGDDVVTACATLSEGEELDLEQADVVARAFLALDLSPQSEVGDIDAALGSILGDSMTSSAGPDVSFKT